MDDADRSFEALYAAEHRSVAHVVFLVVGDRETAHDLTQEAFARLLLHWRKVSRYERPDAWVRQVATRLAISDRRARARHHGGALVDAPVTWTEPDVDLWRALRELSPKQRAVVVLTAYVGLSTAEAAAAVGCAEATARVHLHRARQRLAELLREEVPDVP